MTCMFDTVDIIMLIFSQERKTTAKAVLWCFSGNMIPNAIAPKEGCARRLLKRTFYPAVVNFYHQRFAKIHQRYEHVILTCWQWQGGKSPSPHQLSPTRVYYSGSPIRSVSVTVYVYVVYACVVIVCGSRFSVCSVSLCNERYVLMWVSGVYLQCSLPGNPVQRDVLLFPGA